MASAEMRSWEDKVQELHFHWYSGSYRVRRPEPAPAAPTPEPRVVARRHSWRKYALMGIDMLGLVILIGAIIVNFYLFSDGQILGWLWEQARMIPEALELKEMQREVSTMLGQLSNLPDVQQFLGNWAKGI